MNVSARRAPGWKCERCRRVRPEVGLCAVYGDLCLRCRKVVAALDGAEVEQDVHVMAARRFDRFFAEEVAAGHDRLLAIQRAGARNSGEVIDHG